MTEIYQVDAPTVTDLSAVSSTKFIVGNTFVGSFEHFAVTLMSSATQVVYYRIQLSPDENSFATAGTNQTACSIAVGSSTQIPVSHSFYDNCFGYLRIEASAGSSVANAPVVVKIHGMKRRG